MNDIVLAAVAGAHGIGGALRLKLFTASPDRLREIRVFSAGDKTLTLLDVRPDKMGAIARFAEVTDRTAAEALRGTVLSVPRAALPALPEGEYYHVDLIGRAVQGPDGAVLGTVSAVENFGAGDILEIRLESGKAAMVPYRADIVAESGAALVLDPVWLA